MSKLRESLAETALIVVGVLMAFGIESQWSAAQERVEDVGYLNALVAELRANHLQIQAVRRTAERSSGAIDTLSTVWSVAPDPSALNLPRLLWSATSVAQYSVSFVALESLASSPSWARASTGELQVALSAVVQSASQLERAGANANKYWFDAMEPVFRASIDYTEWQSASNARSGYERERWLALLRQPGVSNMLVHVDWFNGDILNRSGMLLTEIDAAIGAIEAVLPES